MKKVSFLFVFFLTINITQNIYGQTPQLVFAHSYGQGTNGSEEVIRSIEFFNDSIFVAGRVIGNSNIGINSDLFLNGGDSNPVGVCITYDNLDNPFQSSIVGRVVKGTISSDNDQYKIGDFRSEVDFDLSSNNTVIVDTVLFGINDFLISNNSLGNLNWFRYGSFIASDFETTSLGGVLAGYFSQLNLVGSSDTLQVSSAGANDGFIASLDLSSGQVENHKIFASSSNDILASSATSDILNEFSVAGRIDGSMDFGWLGESNVNFNHAGLAAAVVSYSNDLELKSALIFLDLETTTSDSYAMSVVYDSDGNMYAGGFLLEGSYELRLNDYSENVEVNNTVEMFLVKVTNQKELQWVKKFPVDGYSYFRNMEIDHNGFLNVAGSFDTFIDLDGGTTVLNGSPESGFFARWTPEGDLVWAYTVSTSPVYDVCITPENNMYIGGAFTSFGTDFDLSENSSFGLGAANGKDAFLAKYTISDPTSDVFVEQGWQTTEVAEGGSTDAIYVRLSHTPTSPVQVVATPNSQLDLGNGQGVPVTLNFAANNTAVNQQVLNVSAFDDAAVENAHTGTISFAINSTDASFDALTESTITVSISDNDIIGVEELDAFSFSLSPNPASDIAQLVFTSYQHNASLCVFDESGKLVLSEKVNGLQHQLNISSLARGTYSVSIENGGASGGCRLFMKK